MTRYSGMVACELRCFTRSRELAEDLHQEAFRIVLQRLRGRDLADAQKLGAFIRRVARNLALAEIRRAARLNTTGDERVLAAVADPAGDPLACVLRQEQTRRLRRALGRLTKVRDRELLARFYLAEEDRDAIRRDLGVTALHFNRLLFRARRRLGRILEQSANRDGLCLPRRCQDPHERGPARRRRPGERKVRR